MNKYLLFGVDIGNLNRARNKRGRVGDQVSAINRAFKKFNIAAQITGYYRSTGNFVLHTNNRSLKKARSAAQKALKAKVVIFRLAEIEKHVARLRKESAQSTERGIRATPGLALLVEGRTRAGKVLSTERNRLRHVVAAWKLDILMPGTNKLDPSHKARRGDGVVSNKKWTRNSRECGPQEV
jgi:hypothetical protein